MNVTAKLSSDGSCGGWKAWDIKSNCWPLRKRPKEIFKAGPWVGQRLLLDPVDQSGIVLKPGPGGLVVQTDRLIIPPHARRAQRRSPSTLATVPAQFLDRLFQ